MLDFTTFKSKESMYFLYYFVVFLYSNTSVYGMGIASLLNDANKNEKKTEPKNNEGVPNFETTMKDLETYQMNNGLRENKKFFASQHPLNKNK